MIIGIDPGKHGALAKIYHGLGGHVEVFSLPEDIKESRRFIRDQVQECMFGDTHIFVEEVHASPQMGVVSAFSFGRRYEQILSVIETTGYKINHVKPQHWQNAIGVLSGGDKGKLYEKARSIYPNIKFKRSEADALLIAYYGMKTVANHS